MSFRKKYIEDLKGGFTLSLSLLVLVLILSMPVLYFLDRG